MLVSVVEVTDRLAPMQKPSAERKHLLSFCVWGWHPVRVSSPGRRDEVLVRLWWAGP